METRNWYSLDVEETCMKLGTDPQRGLNSSEAGLRIKTYGPNELKKKPPRSLLSMFVSQLKEILVIILLIAVIVSGLVGEWADAAVILIIVILNAAIGVYQENRAEHALEALKGLTKPSAKVLRDGTLVQLSTAELVPGDLVFLDAGDSVPADLRLLEAADLHANESALTGESLPVEKDPATIKDRQVALGDRKNMLFMGTSITAGRAKAIVAATGMQTELGRIAELFDTTDVEQTPLQQRLGQLGKVMGLGAALIVAVVFALGLWRAEDLMEMFMVAISLAVAAVPEGLPAVITVVLALGVTRMSRHKAIIRKLPAVETLGTATVICSDKTGTLTKNEMTATAVHAGGKTFQITGAGYEPLGSFLSDGGADVDLAEEKLLYLTLLGGLLCSDAILEAEAATGSYRIIGDPTEGALVVAAAKAGLNKEQAGRDYPRLAEIPFDSDRKMMTTFHQVDGSCQSFTKGAPDVVLGRCTHVRQEQTVSLTGEERDRLLTVNSQQALQGRRVLALATRQWEEIPRPLDKKIVEQGLTFIGFFAIQDPLRQEAKEAVARCHRAGISTIMITGDHRDTAAAIAGEVGMMQPGDQTLTGEELEHMDDNALFRAVEQTRVFARVSPEHKLRIVEALKHNGHVVAMTGDGVNDAPALKRADIGAAMGQSGTDVAKEAADIVLQDDNFATIVRAVEEGRTIYKNIRGAIQYLLSCNVGEVSAIFTSLLLGLGSPLTAIQILWLNLVTDGPPALALGLEPPQKGIMNRPPRNPKESIFAAGMGAAIIWQGLMIGLLSLTAYAFALTWGRTPQEAQTMTFVTMALSQLVHSLNVRSREQSLFTLGMGSNRSLIYALLLSLVATLMIVFVPFLRIPFDTAMLRPSDWSFVLALSLIPLFVVELNKVYVRYRQSKNAA
jgi:Ca2+-transporting ATPase